MDSTIAEEKLVDSTIAEENCEENHRIMESLLESKFGVSEAFETSLRDSEDKILVETSRLSAPSINVLTTPLFGSSRCTFVG